MILLLPLRISDRHSGEPILYFLCGCSILRMVELYERRLCTGRNFTEGNLLLPDLLYLIIYDPFVTPWMSNRHSEVPILYFLCGCSILCMVELYKRKLYRGRDFTEGICHYPNGVYLQFNPTATGSSSATSIMANCRF